LEAIKDLSEISSSHPASERIGQSSFILSLTALAVLSIQYILMTPTADWIATVIGFASMPVMKMMMVKFIL